jgi:3-phenylpropionate/trans-cinnamate dioxygenase ferredoxin reductase subunit
MRPHLVIIGGGQAATQTIQSARHLGFDGQISLVAEEENLPYQRPPLSKQYLAGEFARERLALRPVEFYESRDVELMLGVRAQTLDLARRQITLATGGKLTFTSVVIATGSRPRLLTVSGAELSGIHYLRSIADVESIIPDFLPGRRLVVVGAGYIGLEVAAVAAKRGLSVTVLEAAERVLARVVAPTISSFYADLHRAAGVDIRCNTELSGLHGTDRIRSVETNGGARFDADLVIVGIGVLPNVELAADAGLEVDGGILVDAHAQTAVAGVAAAGDCTRQDHPFVGSKIRLESVHNAIGQGKTAAHTLAGTPHAFDEVPWFWSDQYDVKLQIAGIATGYDSSVVRGSIEDGSFAVFYLRGEIPIAVDCVQSPRDFIVGKKLLAARKPIPAAILADLDSDLSAHAS